MKNKLIIVGAGGHGRVVASAVLAQGKYELIGFADSGIKVGSAITGELSVKYTIDDLMKEPEAALFVVAIGDNKVRSSVYNKLKEHYSPASIIHPFSHIDPSAVIGQGTVVLAGAVINAGAVIGENSIVNCQSLVDHDVAAGDHTHIERGSVILPGSTIRDFGSTEPGKVYSSRLATD